MNISFEEHKKTEEQISFSCSVRCVFEDMFKVKVNLRFHKYVDREPILDVPVG
jgi:hypothetical protein